MTGAISDGVYMIAACTKGDEPAVRETPSLASQVPEAPLVPLHYAVREGHAGVAQLLLEPIRTWWQGKLSGACD
jgi:hypothetical protein